MDRKALSTLTYFPARKDKPPTRLGGSGVWDRHLTMTYSHMEKLHTTIGDASFHC